jgi:biotin carboxyl carrier protein
VVRRYRVTVSGRVYEVEVEELASGGAEVRSAEKVPAAPPRQAARPQPAAPPAASAKNAHPAWQPAPSASPPAAKGAEVISPLPGKVLSVRAREGQKVKRGDLLLVIEAMKMENEIYAGEAGTVRKVHVAVGQNVETGDTLAELAPGG